MQTDSPNLATWQRAHEELVDITKQKTKLNHQEAEWLRVAHRERTHLFLGFGSFAEYVERTCGYTSRQARERIRVALALAELPVLQEKLEGGEVSWSAARELTRVVTEETENEWLDATAGKSVRDIERLVAGLERGDSSDDGKGGEPKRHVLRVEVGADTYATYREAIAHLQRKAGGQLDEEAALLAMARHVLGGPKDEGRASYQIAMTVCPECGRGTQLGRGEAVPVEPEVVEMAECDAQRLTTHVGHDHPATPDTNRATQDIPPATRRAVMRRDGGRCVVPGCRNATFLDLHHLALRSEGGDHDPDRLISICGAHHKAAHRGALVIEGPVSKGLRFFHADGTEYGGEVSAKQAVAKRDAFLALRSFGFKESEVRGALHRSGLGGTDVPTLVRAALRLLHRPDSVREPRVRYAVPMRRCA